MFVHINPEVDAVGETISTLKFAQRVASIELGAARSNKETGEIRDLKDEVSIAPGSFSLHLYSNFICFKTLFLYTFVDIKPQISTGEERSRA